MSFDAGDPRLAVSTIKFDPKGRQRWQATPIISRVVPVSRSWDPHSHDKPAHHT